VQVLVVNDEVVVALVVAYKLCPADFKAHVVQVREHAAERADGSAAAAYGGVVQMMKRRAVAITNPMRVPVLGAQGVRAFLRSENNRLRRRMRVDQVEMKWVRLEHHISVSRMSEAEERNPQTVHFG
jgi:hypothetical protein